MKQLYSRQKGLNRHETTLLRITKSQAPGIPPREGGRGWGTVHPIVAYTGRLHQKSAFFMLQVYERIAISALEVNRKGREICHFSL